MHLKERIAELEGFIREFKKKPHPRWTEDRPRSSAMSSRSSPQPDPTSEDSINPAWSSPPPRADDNTSSLSSPSSLLLTPPMQGGDPVILSSPPNFPDFSQIAWRCQRVLPTTSIRCDNPTTTSLPYFLSATWVFRARTAAPLNALSRRSFRATLNVPPLRNPHPRHTNTSRVNVRRARPCIRSSWSSLRTFAGRLTP